MSHEIDLSKYELRTDLVIESIDESHRNNIKESKRIIDDIVIDDIKILKKDEKLFNKKSGRYITISFNTLL